MRYIHGHTHGYIDADRFVNPLLFLYSVLGVVNKIGTVVINYTVWQFHASPLGLIFLLACIMGGVMYQQSVKQDSSSNDKGNHSSMKLASSSAPATDTGTNNFGVNNSDGITKKISV